MEVAQKKSVWRNLTVFFIYVHLARCQVTLTHNSPSASADTFICGTNTQFTCRIDPAPGLMSWVKDSATLTNCAGATDICVVATVENYQFTSDVSNKDFYVAVNPVKFSNAGTFTCSNGASVDDSKTLSIAAVPSAITMTQESGTGRITLQATTDCAYPMSDVSVEWYYLKELTDTPQLYTDTAFTPVRTEDSSTCTSGDCTSGVGVSKVVSSVTFNEKGSGGTSAYLQAKMVHSAAPSSSPAVVARTTNKYIIIEDCCFWLIGCEELEDAECITWFIILIILILLVLGILGGMGVQAKCSLWEKMDTIGRTFLFFAFLFGLGLYLIRKRNAASKPDGNDSTNNSAGDIPPNINQSDVMNTKKRKTITLSSVEGGKVTLSCPFPESVTFPEWRGPPKLLLYTIMNDQKGEINSKAPAFERLQYASNKRDLILSNAVTSDSGDYTCSYKGQGNYTIILKVNRAEKHGEQGQTKKSQDGTESYQM